MSHRACQTPRRLIARHPSVRGTFIAEMGASGDVLRRRDFRLDSEHPDQHSYVDARSAFDAGVLRLAMRDATAEDVERLERVLQRIEAAPLDDVPRHHDAFHQALLEATHNRSLASLTIVLYRFFWRLGARAPHVHQVPRGEQVRPHREICEALRRRDEAEIPRLVILHLRQ